MNRISDRYIKLCIRLDIWIRPLIRYPADKIKFLAPRSDISSVYGYPFRPNAKYCSLCTFVSGLHGSPRWFQAGGVVFRFFIKATSLTIFNTFFIFIPCIFCVFVCCCRFVQGNIFKIKFLFQTYVPGICIFFEIRFGNLAWLIKMEMERRKQKKKKGGRGKIRKTGNTVALFRFEEKNNSQRRR